jgi:hypothetical protein
VEARVRVRRDDRLAQRAGGVVDVDVGVDERVDDHVRARGTPTRHRVSRSTTAWVMEISSPTLEALPSG